MATRVESDIGVDEKRLVGVVIQCRADATAVRRECRS